MADFNYEGVDAVGKNVMGTITAGSEREARKALSAQRIRVSKIKLPSSGFDFEKIFEPKTFGDKELLVFTRQLSIMINAGVPIMQSLEILKKSEKHPAMKKAIDNIAIQIGEGKTISEAMGTQKGFDRLYCNLVKAGEAGGMLDEILVKLAVHMDKQAKLRSQIKGSLMYPAIVMLVGILVIWGMMVFIIPVFVELFKENGQKLPSITVFVMDIAEFVGKYTIYIAPALVVLVYSFIQYIRTPKGKLQFDTTIMKVPIFGMIVIKGNLTTFTSTLGTLLSAGVSLLDALEISTQSIDNVVIANDILEIKKKIMEGQTLTEPLGKIPYFPELVVQMVRVGEQTGQIDQMLVKVAQVFQDELDELIGNMTKLIEPFTIVFLGGAVCVMLLAMYMPMFQMAG